MCFILLLLFRLWLCFKLHCRGSSKILSAPFLLLIGVHYLNAGKHRLGGKLHPLSSPPHYLPAENAGGHSLPNKLRSLSSEGFVQLLSAIFRIVLVHLLQAAEVKKNSSVDHEKP